MAHLSVSDASIGIGPDDQEHVFAVCQRLYTNDESDETDIGLTLCRRIIERHGGETWVESEPGEGATFYLTRPTASEPIRKQTYLQPDKRMSHLGKPV